VVAPDEVAARGRSVDLTLAYQAPCHLRNVQGLADEGRVLLAAIPGLTLLEPDDEQQCCGSGGVYSYLQPSFGDAMLARKDASLQRTGADGVVSGNPGCALQIARAGWDVHHPAQLLARSLAVAGGQRGADGPGSTAAVTRGALADDEHGRSACRVTCSDTDPSLRPRNPPCPR
jgi:glycolate oxidase iron-sulfur subunit